MKQELINTHTNNECLNIRHLLPVIVSDTWKDTHVVSVSLHESIHSELISMLGILVCLKGVINSTNVTPLKFSLSYPKICSMHRKCLSLIELNAGNTSIIENLPDSSVMKIFVHVSKSTPGQEPNNSNKYKFVCNRFIVQFDITKFVGIKVQVKSCPCTRHEGIQGE
jgi:hypothetical protein